MEQFIGTSKSGNFQEAVNGLKNPSFIILFSSDKEKFKTQVTELEQTYPGVPSMGCVGQSYAAAQVYEQGLVVIGLCGDVTAVTNILTHVSTMPMERIAQLEQDVRKIGGNANNTVCIDFCSANDECALATIESVLQKGKYPLTGGTAWEGLVCCNGIVYEDACVYGLVKNNKGKVKIYKENIYLPTDKSYIVTKAIPQKYIICELDGRPAEDVYAKELGIAPEKITDQTFDNPLGRVIGDNVYIISLKERMGNKTFSCYRKVNPKDKICILEAGDYEQIIQNTINEIKNDFGHISGVISVNCIFRYLFFQQHHYVDSYFKAMSGLGKHAGLIGLGEHFDGQHTNQTMSCVVFE